MTQVDAVQGKFVTSRKRSINRTAIALLASTALVFPHSLVAGELPTGANIQAGGASIDVTGNLMTVTQGTDRSIINWNSFSVGAGNTVNFIQPGVTSAILNRVTGATPSTIAGTVTGNGLKDVASARKAAGEPVVIDPTPEAASAALHHLGVK